MFDELDKYKKNDHFFLTSEVNLKKVCNAPKDKSGIFLVYELKYGRIELVYIGTSSILNYDGETNANETNLYNTIVNGIQFDAPRHWSWKQKIIDEKIDAFDVYWYVTIDDKFKDSPLLVETKILKTHFKIYSKYPRWNRKQ